eukprot:CAMPEP_0184326728 /NCGR_PEP_ID=MMETSP1049-20130417/142715_1 /TAXON_ID=77928 /ORGANISM="Proteomonas sulcata, Strain CCMP704" /LENGTH=284 /DNA_ID=CAMNT_0026648935 /DNA_START=370 /DNA_END=1224 /DNA_ORIENTATION=+
MGFNPDSLALRFMRHVNAPWVLWINFQINLRIESLQYWLTRTTFSSQMYRWFKIPIDTATFLQLRTCWIDDFVQEFASRYSNTSSQLVILGAGYDSRCYRLTKLPSGMTKFEVDAQGTQKLKKQILTKINVDHSAVRFVTCDFGTEDWVDKLEEKGFSKNIPTCFVWEGVTVYLTEDDVISTLKTVKQCAPGTIIGYDFNAPWLVSKYKEKTKGFGEEWKFGVTPEGNRDLIKKTGLKVLEILESDEMNLRSVACLEVQGQSSFQSPPSQVSKSHSTLNQIPDP